MINDLYHPEISLNPQRLFIITSLNLSEHWGKEYRERFLKPRNDQLPSPKVDADSVKNI